MKKKAWDNTCKVSKSRVELTFESKADTTVPVYYTKESFVHGKPDEIIVLKANERKTTIINKPEIYRFGVSQYDPTTLQEISANKAITFAGVKGTILDGYRLFDSATGLVDTDLTYLDTSKMTNMSAMFNLKLRQSQLKKIDTSNWDTSNVTTMRVMFQGCPSLTYIDTSNWDISKVTDMSYIFKGCKHLRLIDFESFLNRDFSKVSDTSSMFSKCVNILKNPTDADYITLINKIDLSNFSVIGEEMFFGIQINKWLPIKIGKNIKQISLIGDNDTYGDWMPYGVDHFEVEDNNLVYTSDDKKLLISKDGKMLYDVADNIDGTLVIPEGIEKIRTGCARYLSYTNMNNIEQQYSNEYNKLPDDYYLKTYKGVNTIDLPSTLTFIGNRVMQYTDQHSKNPILKTIICRAIEPPIVKDDTFLSYRERNNLTLKVPSESIDKYKTANQWKYFKDIQAIQ